MLEHQVEDDELELLEPAPATEAELAEIRAIAIAKVRAGERLS
jgi:hypothetical protein